MPKAPPDAAASAPLGLVLVIEDEPAIAMAVEDALRHAGYDVTLCGSLSSADAALRAQISPPAALVLDRMLPGGDGLDWLAARRSAGMRTPCLILSARGSEADRCEGLDAGADDYLPKPFSPRELCSRLGALLRRLAHDATAQRFTIGDCTIDLAARTAAGRELTVQEAKLIAYLHARPAQVVSRDELLAQVWGFAGGVAAASRAVDVCVVGLRRKLGTAAKQLVTVRGGGYRLDRG